MKPIKLAPSKLQEIWTTVPTNYYQNGIKNNLLQRLWHTNKLNTIIQQIQTAEKQTILDVGSASGWFLSEIQKKYPTCRCLGIDPYEKAIQYGTQEYPKLELQVADAHKLPFKDNSIDIVLCCEVLEHVEDPLQVLSEIIRVSKNDAKIIIEMDTGNLLFNIIWFFWTHVRQGVWHDAHIQKFNQEILKKTILGSGLTIIQEKTFNFSMAVSYLCRRP